MLPTPIGDSRHIAYHSPVDQQPAPAGGPVPGESIPQTVSNASPGFSLTSPNAPPITRNLSLDWLDMDALSPEEMRAIAEHCLPPELVEQIDQSTFEPKQLMSRLPPEWPLAISLALDEDLNGIVEVEMNTSRSIDVPAGDRRSIYTPGLITCTGIAVVHTAPETHRVMLAHYDHTKIGLLLDEAQRTLEQFSAHPGSMSVILLAPSGSNTAEELRARLPDTVSLVTHAYEDDHSQDATRSRALIVHVADGRAHVDGMAKGEITEAGTQLRSRGEFAAQLLSATSQIGSASALNR